jgi:hypothetical protein
MSDVDFVITNLEVQLETPNNPFGSFVAFKFVDTYPYFNKTKEMLNQIKNRTDVSLIDYEYSYTGIDEHTDLKYLEVVKH